MKPQTDAYAGDGCSNEERRRGRRRDRGDHQRHTHE
jgi:hypothetical protein